MPTIINMSSGVVLVNEGLDEIFAMQAPLAQLTSVSIEGSETPILINIDHIISATPLSQDAPEASAPPREIL